MGPFSGAAEPLVGEIVGLRTFRVDESGLLLPLYSSLSWYDGPNTAECAPPTGDAHRTSHPVPADECECGFYAYGTDAAINRHRQARYVQAVVACWGGVVAGTRGVRAEHARIDAIWLHRNVPQWARRRVASRYPSARLYDDRERMLREHPLSQLPCYAADEGRHWTRTSLWLLLAALLLALGAVPMPLLRAVPAVWTLWFAVTCAVGAFGAWLLLGSHETGHRAAALVVAGVFAWMLAPLLGLPGWLLRVPLLRAGLVAVGGYLLALRPGYFPIEKTAREPAFCGVRP